MAAEAANEQIVDQVLGRLTQLRMELSADGRAVLDEMIVGQAAEVTGHQLTSDQADASAVPQVQGAMISGQAIDLAGEEYRVISP